MLKRVFLSLVMLLSSASVYAETTQGFNYNHPGSQVCGAASVSNESVPGNIQGCINTNNENASNSYKTGCEIEISRSSTSGGNTSYSIGIKYTF